MTKKIDRDEVIKKIEIALKGLEKDLVSQGFTKKEVNEALGIAGLHVFAQLLKSLRKRGRLNG